MRGAVSSQRCEKLQRLESCRGLRVQLHLVSTSSHVLIKCCEKLCLFREQHSLTALLPYLVEPYVKKEIFS